MRVLLNESFEMEFPNFEMSLVTSSEILKSKNFQTKINRTSLNG